MADTVLLGGKLPSRVHICSLCGKSQPSKRGWVNLRVPAKTGAITTY